MIRHRALDIIDFGILDPLLLNQTLLLFSRAETYASATAPAVREYKCQAKPQTKQLHADRATLVFRDFQFLEIRCIVLEFFFTHRNTVLSKQEGDDVQVLWMREAIRLGLRHGAANSAE